MIATAPPATTTADSELADLVADHGPRWSITRSTDYRGSLGAFHAVRHDPRPALQGLRAATAEELHAAIECAEAGTR